MKQKIVMKVQMNCQKCRSKALQIVTSTIGVDSVAIEGNEQDQMVVIGDGVDFISMISLLRKKVGHTEVVTMEEVKPKEEKKEEKKDEKKDEKIEAINPSLWIQSSFHYPQIITYEQVYEPDSPNCSIM